MLIWKNYEATLNTFQKKCFWQTHRIVQHSPYLRLSALWISFLNWKFISRLRLGDIKRNIMAWLHIIPKKVFQRCFDQWQTHWNNKHVEFYGDYKKITVLYIVNFCLAKDRFSLNAYTICLLKQTILRENVVINFFLVNFFELLADSSFIPVARETWVQSQVESYQRLKKWYLMLPCLALSIIRYGSRVK